MSDKKLTDDEILKNVAAALKKTLYEFAKDMNYTAMAMYHITNGKKNKFGDIEKHAMSSKLKDRIVFQFPNVLRSYLDTGEGPILKEAPAAPIPIGETGFFTIKNLAHIPAQLDRIEAMLKEITGN